MWSHYADCHQGVCLQFSDLDRFCRPLGIIRQVDYTHDLPVFSVFRMDEQEYADKIGFEILLRKSPKWSYEEEWRSVTTRPAHLQKFPPECLTGVIFGCRLRPEQ